MPILPRAADYRVIQFTPPGSACSIIFGTNVTSAAPGTAQGLYLIVTSVEAARQGALKSGVEVSEPFHAGVDVYSGEAEPFLCGQLRLDGLDPDRRSYRSFASFNDPDGNGWLLQEISPIGPAASMRPHDILVGGGLRRSSPAGGRCASANTRKRLRRATIIGRSGTHDFLTGEQHGRSVSP